MGLLNHELLVIIVVCNTEEDGGGEFSAYFSSGHVSALRVVRKYFPDSVVLPIQQVCGESVLLL